MTKKEGNEETDLPQQTYEQKKTEMLAYLRQFPEQLSSQEQQGIERYAELAAQYAKRKMEERLAPEDMLPQVQGAIDVLRAIYNVNNLKDIIQSSDSPIIPETDAERVVVVQGIKQFVHEALEQNHYRRAPTDPLLEPTLFRMYALFDGKRETLEELSTAYRRTPDTVAGYVDKVLVCCSVYAVKKGNEQFNTLVAKVGFPRVPQSA